MTDKLLFIHIPKTAGSSLNRTPIVQAASKKIHPFNGLIEDKITEIGAVEYFKFGFVRNPWARFFSLYNYFYKMDENHIHYKYNAHIVKVVKKFDCFSDFCRDFPSLRLRNNFHFYPQSRYVFDRKGKQILDYLGHVENLAYCVQELCETLGLKSDFQIPHVNKSTSDDYRLFYTAEDIKLIEEYFSEDVLRFNYRFE
ncbi:sulfotransferase family 2 domain-containing protein [Alteromonas macleodii]|uniref:Putative Sulfotransferase family n=1 Tax=Alteromonas macleodii TaxID=28108 RepID=A0A6T9Y3Y2_ALTMA|nr:sulfotransferase family 2 domain-containing protein [Alteromonas macleodii]CAB9495509.1 putative Sulfotransferase family [Alteromonas macleodii]